jgi:hypothetical protein
LHTHTLQTKAPPREGPRSRGGLTTKIHVVVDAQGLRSRLGLTAGQAHDGQITDTLLLRNSLLRLPMPSRAFWDGLSGRLSGSTL